MWKFQLSIHPSIYNHIKIETIYCKIKWDDLQVNSKTQWKQKILMKWNKAQKENCICRVFHLRQNSNLLIISACKKDRTLLMVASYSPWKMFFLWAFDNCFAIISSPQNLPSILNSEIPNVQNFVSFQSSLDAPTVLRLVSNALKCLLSWSMFVCIAILRHRVTA